MQQAIALACLAAHDGRLERLGACRPRAAAGHRRERAVAVRQQPQEQRAVGEHGGVRRLRQRVEGGWGAGLLLVLLLVVMLARRGHHAAADRRRGCSVVLSAGRHVHHNGRRKAVHTGGRAARWVMGEDRGHSRQVSLRPGCCDDDGPAPPSTYAAVCACVRRASRHHWGQQRAASAFRFAIYVCWRAIEGICLGAGFLYARVCGRELDAGSEAMTHSTCCLASLHEYKMPRRVLVYVVHSNWYRTRLSKRMQIDAIRYCSL